MNITDSDEHPLIKKSKKKYEKDKNKKKLIQQDIKKFHKYFYLANQEIHNYDFDFHFNKFDNHGFIIVFLNIASTIKFLPN